METRSKVGLAVGAAILALGVPFLLKLKRLAEELETVTTVNIHHVSLTGMKLRADVILKNPTETVLKVKHPFVKMVYKDTVFATSQMKDQDYDVPKFGEKQIDPIYIDLSFIQLAMQVPDLLKDYRKTGKLSMTVKTVTTINNNVPYVKTDNLTV